jgi:hypothetical protein
MAAAATLCGMVIRAPGVGQRKHGSEDAREVLGAAAQRHDHCVDASLLESTGCR